MIFLLKWQEKKILIAIHYSFYCFAYKIHYDLIMTWIRAVMVFLCFLCSWDESSSISSGLSDGSDNLSSEEFNAGSSLNSLPTTPIGSRRNSAIVVIHFNWIEILLAQSVFLLQGLLHQLANL